MKSNKLPAFVSFLILLMVISACASGDFSLENPRMTADLEGTRTIASYPVGAKFFNTTANLNNAPLGTTVEAKWYAEDVPGVSTGLLQPDTPNILTVDKESFTGTVNMTFNAPLGGGWVAGSYKVELYLDGVLVHTVKFIVQ